jgi:AraC-like DNA-binding protein
VVIRIGFREPHYFSRVFRRAVGVTPIAYQRAQAAGRSRAARKVQMKDR